MDSSQNSSQSAAGVLGGAGLPSAREKAAVASLAVASIFSMMFLYGVSATNASFQGTAFPVSPAWNVGYDVSPQLSATLTVVGENLGWSVSTASAQVQSQLQQPVLAFLGIDPGSQGFQSNVVAQPQPLEGIPVHHVAQSGVPAAPPVHGMVLGATHVSSQ